MDRMRLFAAGALVACAASGAGADPPKHNRTTCDELKKKFDPPAKPSWDACHNQHFFDAAFDASPDNAENDQPVIVYRARRTARYELLVFFPGGGGTPGPYDGFMTKAAELGYDVVGVGVPSFENAVDGTPVHTQPGDICGCLGACYGEWHARQFSGGVGGNLPPVPQPSSIKRRLRRVLEHYRDAQSWPSHDRWGTYLCNDKSGDCEAGEINWRKVVLAGHSDGSRVSTYIASQVRVRKVILFSGIPESAGKQRGCKDCEPIIGPDSDPPMPQTYSTAKCVPDDVHPPDYIWKHNFDGHTGPPYATGRERFWALVDAADQTCRKEGSTRTLGEAGLTLNQLHDAGLADGFAFWGPHDVPEGTYAATPQNDFRGHHVIMANDLCGDVDAAHNATVQDGKCSGIGAIYRGDIWHFLLTR
jgi:pimeloyl-ACP methyl ester carboxylesterase